MEQQKSTKTYVLQFFLFAIIAAPVTILLHEVGHYIAARVAGFENPVIHFAYTSFGTLTHGAAAEATVVALLGGPLSSAIQVIICAILLAFFRHPLLYTIGIFAQARVFKVFYQFQTMDETKIAELFNLPIYLTLLISWLIFIIALVYFSVRLKQEIRLLIVYPIMIVGLSLGAIAWFKWLGPLILP
jgi:hypothetical protein